ncbi:hypothetical protein TanjilG_19306 [Lupinus angustifolius]|uniref:Tudor domain-containing protein n=1 Tax=Lupinus angustifolius TaxID=3871 RepID=A0A1J7GXJ7_LUPAN|nr:PREDICTED: scopoletin glucosyltransferase-like [Lupinus angustifolius]OIV94300.1 hypothetical protein TanjilG_19306 [Lupinus angustifolius]
MGAETIEHSPIHIMFFPFMGHGHMIPLVDMAKLFASKGVKTTILTTPLNAPFIFKTIEKSKSHSNINIQTIKFPCVEAGLPDGCENVDSIPSPELVPVFFKSTELLQEGFEQQLSLQHPDCVVSDMFFTWTSDSSAKFNIPRIVFHGISLFSMCVSICMAIYKPYENVSSDSESFVVPNLPGEIKMTRIQVMDYFKIAEWIERMKKIGESEEKSYGILVNSFYELERDYIDYFRKVLGKRAWQIGPLSLCNIDEEQKKYRGKEVSIDEHEWQKWLDTKETNSVVYVSFGSVVKFSDSQLREIAIGLEASGQQFIWVVKKSKNDGEEWLPEGFEKKIEGKGLIIRGWAPQVLILEHEAIGAFMTHCGWNSTLEGVAAGVPFITWPVSAEQFYNEKLVVDILKIGVPVGVKKWCLFSEIDQSIQWEAIEKTVRKILAKDEEAEEKRNKAKELSRLARKAVEEGGSSDLDLDSFIAELGSLRG